MVMVMPLDNGQNFGVEVLLASYEWFKADILISCMDVWVLPAHLTSHTRFCPWIPVDHDPVPEQICASLSTALYPMAFSKWGVGILANANIKAKYVPCSADASVFVRGYKDKSRKAIGVPDECDFFVSMVAANKDPGDRKGFGEALQGFARFHANHPNSYLYLHTNWNGAVNIGHLCDRLGIRDHVMRPDPYPYLMGMMTPEYMQTIYSASDLLLNPAKSEGFGLPVLEAQMCGTPVALTDFSTSRELLFGGWMIKGQPDWSIGADSFRLRAYIDSVVGVLEEAYADRGNELLSLQARKGAMQLDTEQVFKNYWVPALKDIEEIVEGKGGELKLVTF